MMIPAGQLGSQVQTFLGGAGSANASDKIPVTINLGGTVKDPKTNLIAAEQKEQLKKAAEQKTQEAVQQILKGDKPEDVVKSILNPTAKTDSAAQTQPADTTKTQQPTDALQNQLQNLLKKKKKN